MHDINDNNNAVNKTPSSEIVSLMQMLSEEERMLIVLQKELYEGSWQAMLCDLQNRLDGKPYIFKLANRIRDDIERIHRLANLEDKYQVRLSDYLENCRRD